MVKIMTKDIRKVVKLSIKEGKIDQFKSVASLFIEKVNTSEPDTVSYEWYLSDDGRQCYIIEIYKDSASLLKHLDNVRDLYEPMLNLCEITRVRVFGDVSEAVRDAHIAGSEFYSHWAGITRWSEE